MVETKRVHMKILVSITEDAEVLVPSYFDGVLKDIEACFESRNEAVAMLKGFDIEHLRRR